VDGNTDHVWAAETLRMVEDGDPAADGRLPERPSLSGEWAGSMTPAALVLEVTGRFVEDVDPDHVDELCGAWEESAARAFDEEAERVLRAAAGLGALTAEDVLEAVGDPDTVGSSEFRAIADVITDALEDVGGFDPLAMARAVLTEFCDHVAAIREALDELEAGR